MRLTTIAAAAAAVNGVSAFKDTSPFFLFSTSGLSDPKEYIGETDNVATAGKVKDHVLSMLRDCPSETYLVVGQAGVQDTDFAKATHLQTRLSGEDLKVNYGHTIRSVVGDLSATDLTLELARHCNLETISLKDQQLPPSGAKLPQLITVDLPPVSQKQSEKDADMSKHDAYINSIINSLPTDSYTVIYQTTPPTEREYSQSGDGEQQQKLYDMDEQYPSTLHPDHFKRNAKAYPRAETGGNVGSNLPLFERYTFLSSGIFMGGTVSLLLLLILYIGISAISGLEVSYHAFSKDFNPASQKKQQ